MLEQLQQAINRVQGLPCATYKEKLASTFGVVVECDAPRTTGGTDLLQTIRLVDESCPDGVTLCIFGQDVNKMPRAQLGDILEVRNVIVQFYQDRPQLFAKMSKPHCFGYLLYRTNGSAVQAAEAQPVQLWNTTADSHYAAERLPQLQALRTQAVGHAMAADMSVYLRRIKDLAPPEEEGQRPACVDMRVRVLAIDQRRADEEVIMYVWDATDAKPVCASLQMPPSEYKGTQLQAARPRRHVMPLQSEAPGLQVLQDLPPIGTALPVIMDPAAVPSTGLRQVGDWVKIKVVGVAAVQGQWQVVFGKTSRLTQSRPSPAFETFYRTRLENHDTCEWPTDLFKIATHCSIMPALPRITVRQMLLQVSERRPGPFRVQLRLLGHWPQELQQWCKMRPQEGGGEPVWEWAAHLWLEDATGEVRALLLGQEGTKLLDIPPQCLSNTTVLQELQSKLRYLATVDDEGGVWIDAALTPLYAQQDQQQQQQPAADQPDLVKFQQEQQQQGLETGEPEQPREQADQQQQQQQQQLQVVPVQQRADAGTQEQPGSQAQQQAHPQQQVQQSQQQGLQPAGATQLPPVFILHDAVLVTEDAQFLQQDAQHEQPEHAAQPDQQEQQQIPRSPADRQPADHDMQQLQASSPNSAQHEGQQQRDDVGLPDASPQMGLSLSGRKRRHSDGRCTVL